MMRQTRQSGSRRRPLRGMARGRTRHITAGRPAASPPATVGGLVAAPEMVLRTARRRVKTLGSGPPFVVRSAGGCRGQVPRPVLDVNAGRPGASSKAAGVGGGDARMAERVEPEARPSASRSLRVAPVRRHAPRTGRRVRELLRPFGAIGAVLSRPQLARYLAASNDFCFRHRW
jgi:hypothetical protein